MTNHQITGGGGIQLNVIEAGNPGGHPILFIHGFSQCWLAWSRQLNSDLANDFRLVAIDLRGHGLSDKPRDAYADSRLWADDINAVIQTLRLDRPILCSWSYGLVPLDYIRHYGDKDIGGLHLVGALTKLGGEDAMLVLTPEVLAAAPGLFATDTEQTVHNLRDFIRMLFARQLSAEDLYLVLGYNVSVPPHVRQALLSRVVDNDDLLPKIRKPVLITHSNNDAVVKSSVVDQHKALIPHAQIHIMANAGHAPFWDDAAAFNARLRAFAENPSNLTAFQ
ncbi:MAG TPA: alpha/beta hydrolase [Chthoniobacterales bacterium]|jgi:pimeloyl-ACP methyl ester carboxylesterase